MPERPLAEWAGQARQTRARRDQLQAQADATTSELAHLLANAYEDGHTGVDLAKELGVTKAYVYRLISEARKGTR